MQSRPSNNDLDLDSRDFLVTFESVLVIYTDTVVYWLVIAMVSTSGKDKENIFKSSFETGVVVFIKTISKYALFIPLLMFYLM